MAEEDLRRQLAQAQAEIQRLRMAVTLLASPWPHGSAVPPGAPPMPWLPDETQLAMEREATLTQIQARQADVECLIAARAAAAAAGPQPPRGTPPPSQGPVIPMFPPGVK